MTEKPAIFLSYSHKDTEWLEFVQSHLGPSVAHGRFTTWDDRRIQGGDAWESEIEQALDGSAVFILLVSRHSLSSDFILKKEVRPMLEKHRPGGARIYPIVLTACDWGAADWLKEFNLKPRDAKALASFNEGERDEQMALIAAEIRRLLADWKAPPAPETPAPSAPAIQAPRIIPIDRVEPKPEIFGRDVELKTLVRAVLDRKLAIVAGGPGMGKTAVAAAAFYDPDIVSRFGSRRVFVSMETATEARALLTELVGALGLPATGDDATLLRLLAQQCAEQAVAAILDNAETAFESSRGEAERLLRLLSQIEGLHLLVTIRGVVPNVPGAVSIEDLPKLDSEAARDAFLAASGPALGEDPDLPALLEALDGHALSLQLVAARAVGLVSLRGLLDSWNEAHAKLLSRPGEIETRLTSVRASLAISLNSPRMRDLPHARRLLSVVAYLPAGLLEEDVRTILGKKGAVSRVQGAEIIACLHQHRLVERRPDLRLRMLNPLRECVKLDIPIQPTDKRRMADHFLEIACSGEAAGTQDWPGVQVQVEGESGNLDTICELAIRQYPTHPKLVDGLAGLLELNRFTGLGGIACVESAIASPHFASRPIVRGKFLQRLGSTLQGRARLETAEGLLKEALTIAKVNNHLLLQAHCLEDLGVMETLRSHDPAAARALYDQALTIYRKINDRLGVANVMRALATLDCEMSMTADAVLKIDEAIALFKACNAIAGEANCIELKAQICLNGEDTTESLVLFDEAARLYEKSGHRNGIANINFDRAEYFRSIKDYDAAEAIVLQALEQYKVIGDVLGQANANQLLGHLFHLRKALDQAAVKLRVAIDLYEVAGIPASRAPSLVRLGMVLSETGDSSGAARIDDGFTLYYASADPSDRALPGWRLLHEALRTRDPAEQRRLEESVRTEWRAIGRHDLVRNWLHDPA